MDETWTTRELPVLQALVRYFDDPYATGPTWQVAADMVGLDHDSFRRALAKLANADPPFVQGVRVAEKPFPVRLTGVTERALLAVGQWPTPETLVTQLVDSITQAAEDETEPEHKSKLRSAASVLAGIGRDVAVSWATAALPHP